MFPTLKDSTVAGVTLCNKKQDFFRVDVGGGEERQGGKDSKNG